MKIVKWLFPHNSAVNGEALIRVEPDEIADIEEMLNLVDGDNSGHYGIEVELIKVGERMPEIKRIIRTNRLIAEKDFDFPNASEMKKQVRYYRVFIDRD